MTMIRVAPARGRTVRYPAGHEFQGEEIPAEGGLVDAGSAFVKRYMLTGDLVVVAQASKPSMVSRNPRNVPTPPEAPAASASPFDDVEALDVDEATLRGMSVKRLLELAQRAGVAVPEKASKLDLINAILAASEPADEGA